ncbi:MAG: efflux RND transporter permease subunit [Candidatus Neomarinimicrobiota bacterium]
MAERRHIEPVFREFKLTSFAIDHATSILVLTGIVILMGLRAYLTVPKESAPEIVIPNIIVNTIYPGVAPGDIETLLTRPLEEELNTITDVKQITSVSVEGYSSINVEFIAGTDMNEALRKVRERIDVAKPKLPAAAEDPRIFEINISEFPIMQVNISGDYGLVRLREVAEDLQDELEQIASVLEVTLSGGLEREVQVDVDLAKLKFYDLSFDDVINAIRDENVTTPGGAMAVGAMKYLVRVPGEFTATAPIADVVIIARRGRPIYVRDVATVDFGFKERDSYARLDHSQVISLAVSKRSGENIIETAEAVLQVIAEVKPKFPMGTVVKITSDQSEDIRDMVSSLENNIISGIILVVSVLLFFLGVRTASFVGLAIPLSMLLSFSIIQLAGFTMNFVVLFSLILVLGMLVDNAIVVVENIYRFRELGYSKVEAAKLAPGEVAMPIIASTATTVAAFLPLAFWPGIVGEFMRFLPLTLIITLSASLFVGLVIVPTLCSLWLEPEGTRRANLTRSMRMALAGAALLALLVGLATNWLTTILLTLTAGGLYLLHRYLFHHVTYWFMSRVLPAILRIYERRLRWALEHRLRMLAGSFLAFVVTMVAFGLFNAGVEFFPENIPPFSAYVQVEAPLGTNVNQTNQTTLRIEEALAKLPADVDYESLVGTVGSSLSGGFSARGGTHLATVAVQFVDIEDRSYDTFNTLEHMRATLDELIAGAEVSVEEPSMGPPTGAPINIEISGQNPSILKRLGDEAVAQLQRSRIFGKLDGLESDMADARPELVIEVDREKAALYGLNTRDVGYTIRSAINGTEASTYRDSEDEYDIIVRLAKPYRDDLSTLADLTVVNENGQQIPLSSISTWWVGQGSGDVNRKNLERVVTISSDVRSGYNENAVLREVRQELARFEASLPSGYQLRYTGQQQEQQEAESFLSGAFMMAILLIALILISQFDSVFKPLIILSSVILSTIGVLIGLLVFRMPFGIIMTGLGVISLAGVVVNNAIVLIDYINTLRWRDGLDRLESLVTGGMTRFRPVILTAITTVLGLVPLAVGLNIDFLGMYSRLEPELYWGGEQSAWWGPMAIAVIAGLTFATFLTLLLVPVMVSTLDSVEVFFRRYFTRRGEESGAGLESAATGLAPSPE